MDKVEHEVRLMAAMSRAGKDRTLIGEYVGVTAPHGHESYERHARASRC